MRVVLMSGIAGAGKSTYVKGLLTKHPSAVVCSADSYFTDSDGHYHFDPAKLGEAHKSCMRRYAGALMYRAGSPVEVVIVDNTNTTSLELAPYVGLANAFSIPVYLVTVKCDPETAFKRNVHGVSFETIKRMSDSINSREIPRFWEIALTLDGTIEQIGA